MRAALDFDQVTPGLYCFVGPCGVSVPMAWLVRVSCGMWAWWSFPLVKDVAGGVAAAGFFARRVSIGDGEG